MPTFKITRPDAQMNIRPRLKLKKTEEQKRKEPRRAKKARGDYALLILDNGPSESDDSK